MLFKHTSALRSRALSRGVPDLCDGKFTLARWAGWPVYLDLQSAWADQWICCTQSAMTGFTAKISNGNCQIVELGDEKHVCLLLTAASIKNKQWKKGNWSRVILLLSIFYSFYHGKITCNIRLYLQFHFYKMSLQDFLPGSKTWD